MKKALLIASVLFIAVISTACINNIAVQELNNKAAEYMQKGDYEAAVNRLQASIDLDSSLYETHYNLGIAATNAKKYDIAIEAFENGIKIKPDFADLYYALATAQIEYAELLDEKDDIDIKEKMIIVKLKHEASDNLKSYLNKKPDAKDKDNIEDIVIELEQYLDKHRNYPEQIKTEG